MFHGFKIPRRLYGDVAVPLFWRAQRVGNCLLSPLIRSPTKFSVSPSAPLHFFWNPPKYFSAQKNDQQKVEEAEERARKAQMVIAFTCTKCDTRNTKTMSKLAYTKGVVIITCEGCRNTHLIADHLGWFEDSSTTVEDILKAKGENVIKIEGKENDYEAIPTGENSG